MILGISLVVNELNKGQRMVFRYPESIPTSIERGPHKGLIKLYNQYFSLSLENLAKLFRPKNALFSKVLEISIDDLCFVSYPCQCQGLAYEGMVLESDMSGTTGNPLGISPILTPLNVPSSGAGEVITMFNVIITSVSSKAMHKINSEFVFKCQYKFASAPGCDPVAAALGLRSQSYGVCRQTLRRLVEAVAIALLQQEKSSHYVTDQVTLMLRIMDNWHLTKQTDTGANGVPVMESGAASAIAICSRTGECEGITPVGSRANSTRLTAAAATSAGTVESATATAGSAASAGSVGSTPRTSRSNSNAPLVDTVGGAGTGATLRHSRTNSAVTSDMAAAAVPGARGPTPPLLGSASGIARSLSIDTVFTEGTDTPSGRTSPTTTTSAAAASATHTASSTATASAGVALAGPPSHPPAPTYSAINAAQLLLQGSARDFMHPSESSGKNSPSGALAGAADSAHSVTSLLGSQAGSFAPSSASRTNSGLAPPLPSRATSGVSTTPGKSAALAAGAGGLSGVTSGGPGDTLGSPVSKDRRSTEWGSHLLNDYLAQSMLANELRVLYHNIIGGHSVNVTFNDVKSANIPLFCKDRAACEESLQMSALRYCAGSDLHGAPSSQVSSGTAVRPGTGVIALRGSGSGGKFRQAASPYLRSGNLHSALQGNTPSRGRNSKDSAKLKGINLNSQTMLKIADTDRIMNILHSLDSSSFSVLSGLSDSGGSGLTSAAGSSADLESMRHQLRALSSSRLQALIEASDPTKSFLDISLLLDEPVEELVAMANYLRSWGLAEVMPVIYGRSCFKVHAKAVLHRDSGVGRAYEALLLSFKLPLWDAPDEDAAMSRPNSEPFLLTGEPTYDAQLNDTGAGYNTKRRSSSVASTDGSYESLKAFQYMHNQNQSSAALAAAGAPAPGQSTSAAAAAHYVVSPAISKYRQRREGAREDLQTNLRSSRSSDPFLKGLLLSPSGSDAAQQGNASRTAGDPVSPSIPPAPTLTRAVTGDGNDAAPSAQKAFTQTATARSRSRERGNSFGAPDRQAGGLQSVFSVFFGQSAAHANNEVRAQREMSANGNTQAQAQAGARSAYRDTEGTTGSNSGAVTPTSALVIPESIRASSGSALPRDEGRSGEVVENALSSSFPPSNLGTLTFSAANRDLGFRQVVNLAEVGNVNASLLRSPLPGEAGDYSGVGSTGRSPYTVDDTPAEEVAPVVHNLDVADNIPAQYSLPVVLATFDGARALQEVIQLLPAPLRDFAVDIVVFLLRWHLIVPMDTFIVNLHHIMENHNANTAPDPASLAGSALSRLPSASAEDVRKNAVTAYAGKEQRPASMLSSSGSRVNFALGTSMGGETSAFSISPGNHFPHGQSFSRGFSESKSSFAQMDDVYSPLRAQLPADLSQQECALMERVYPVVHNQAVSSKTLGEIAWMLRVPEEDLVHVIEKVSYLQLVKKVSS